MNATVDLMPVTNYQKLSPDGLKAELRRLDTHRAALPTTEYKRRAQVCHLLLHNCLDALGIQQFQAAIVEREKQIARLMEVTE